MLQLRPEHIEALDAAGKSEFHRRLMARFRTKMPTLTAKRTDDELVEVLATADQDARKYGLTTFRDISQWCLLAVIAGPGFHQIPAVNQVLMADPIKCGEVLPQLVSAFAAATQSQDKQSNPPRRGSP